MEFKDDEGSKDSKGPKVVKINLSDGEMEVNSNDCPLLFRGYYYTLEYSSDSNKNTIKSNKNTSF